MLQLVLALALSLGLHVPEQCGVQKTPPAAIQPPPDSGKPIIRN